MKNGFWMIGSLIFCLNLTAEEISPANKDLDIRAAGVQYVQSLDLLVFTMSVKGQALATTPEAAGRLDGAPVLGYVFPTTLDPRDVGFGVEDGLVALAVTSHPDFDDTPLWDENLNRDYSDDGEVYHVHWVVLVGDDRVPGGLAVAEIAPETAAEILPPTNPGMPMLMDSPGFSIVKRGNTFKVLVPANRINNRRFFRFDAVTAYMEVSLDPEAPLLGVYEVFDILSDDLSLPFGVSNCPF